MNMYTYLWLVANRSWRCKFMQWFRRLPDYHIWIISCKPVGSHYSQEFFGIIVKTKSIGSKTLKR